MKFKSKSVEVRGKIVFNSKREKATKKREMEKENQQTPTDRQKSRGSARQRDEQTRKLFKTLK